jgi:hypothetical protein
VAGQRIALRFSSIGAAKELEYGAGAQQAVAERGDAYKLVKDSINEIAKRMGKSPEDAAYIMLDALKGMLSKRWKGQSLLAGTRLLLALRLFSCRPWWEYWLADSLRPRGGF